MKTRIISGIFLAIIAASSLYVGSWYLFLLCAFISLVGMYELYRAAGIHEKLLGKEVMMGKIQIKLFVCFGLAVTLVMVLRLALVALVLIGFGRILVLMAASLLQLNLIK